MINSQQHVPGPTAVSQPPAAITNGDNYILAWTNNDQSIWWMTCPASSDQDSYNWGRPVQILNAASSGSPALANLNGQVWMAWKGEGADTRIFVSSLSSGVWSPGVPVSEIGTSSSPALTAANSELFLSWKGETDSTLFWSKSSDGKAWSRQTAVPGGASSDTPALAGWEQAVYFAWKGAGDNSIWLAQWSDAGGWAAPPSRVTSAFQTDVGPALGFGDSGNVHLAWKGESDSTIWAATLGGADNTWSPQTKIPVVATATRPALASQGSAATNILLAWKGAAGSDLWVGPLDALENKQVLNYDFGIGKVNVVTQRSANDQTDSDYLTLSVAVGSNLPIKKTVSLGNHVFNDVFDANLSVTAAIADDEKVVMSYIMLNHGNSQTAAEIMGNLESAGETLAKAAIAAYATEASISLGMLANVVLPGIGAVIVPLLDSALIAIGNWLVNEATNLISVISPGCDGPVASGVHAFNGAQLRNAGSPLLIATTGTDNCAGLPSAAGCGDNSLYVVSWVINGMTP